MAGKFTPEQLQALHEAQTLAHKTCVRMDEGIRGRLVGGPRSSQNSRLSRALARDYHGPDISGRRDITTSRGLENPLGNRVSVLIPAYNQDHFISAAVESALRQAYANLEVVIADDCSTDRTGQIAAGYAADTRVRYLRNTSRLGRVSNYRKLLAEATGEWVLMLDADDYLTNDDYITHAMRLACSDPGVVLVIGKALSGNLVETAELLNAGIQESAVIDGSDLFLSYPALRAPVPLHLSCLYRRDRAVDLHFYREDILSSDFESFYRLMLGHKVGVLNEISGLWRQHTNNVSNSIRYRDVARNLRMFKGMYEYARTLRIFPDAVLNRWLSDALALYFLNNVGRYVRERRTADALRLTVAMVARWPSLLSRPEIRAQFWQAVGPAKLLRSGAST